jgi:hypothetical protein
MHGKIHGRTIELDEDAGASEGQEVEVQVTFLQQSAEWGEGIRRSAGGWADFPEMDTIMEDIYQARKLERRSQIGNS